MTRKSFDDGLRELHNDLLRMGSIVEKQVYNSIEALKNQDSSLAEKIIAGDDIVDKLQKEIEDKCIRLIGREQPLAVDLRTIFTTTKLATDLERMADHAVDIAKITLKLKNEKYIKPLIDIPRMASLVQLMLREALDAYVDLDEKKALEISKQDDEVDAIYKDVFMEIINLMAADQSIIPQGVQFLFVCKFLERIGDHVTNICEWTIYLVTGELMDLNE